MKEGWTYKKLGEVATFARGLTYSKKDEVDFSANVVLRSNNIDLSSGKLDFSELKYLEKGFDIPPEKRVKKGSIFICMSNGSKAHLGKVAYVDKDYNYAFGGFMGQITPNNEVDGLYLHYVLSSPVYKDYIKSLSEGANINNLKFKDLSEFVIAYPSLSEQHSIVSHLDVAFAHIDALKANAEKQLAEASQLFQAELTECMRQKEGWEEKKMSDFFEITSSKRVFQKDWTTSGIPFYRAREIVKINKQGFVDNELFITEEMYEEYKKKYGVPQIGDILITGVGTLGVCYVIKDSKKFYYKDGNIIWLKKKSSINSDFVTYQYLCPSIKKQIYKTEGATVGTYTITNANDTKILVPSIETQNQIVSRLDALSANIKQLEEVKRKTLAECDALKQAMLREVFE